jgi:hypothetical protein
MRTQVGAARLAAIAAVAIVTASVWAPGDVAAASLCVGGPGCYATLQQAVDAAHDGDRIMISPGTYAGGVTIPISVRLIGSGAAVTTIRGGGPVLTIGTYGAADEPTVVIAGVTITGGVTRTSQQSMDWVGTEGVVALGGGIEIPPNADYSGGAAVTIKDSVIAGNRAAPSATAPVGPPCPSGPCPFALASGGGIDSWGSLILVRTVVSHNSVGAATGLSNLASDAEAAGIRSWQGHLVLRGSRVTDNRATAVAPNGRFADGGGIFVNAGTFDMTGSTVSGNAVSLAAAMPDTVDTGAHAGGIHLADGVTSARIVHSAISGNFLKMTNSVGTANAFSGGVHVDLGVEFSMSDSDVSRNRVTVVTPASSSGLALADSGAGEIHGTIARSTFVGNTVSARSATGSAYALAGASIFTGTFSAGALASNRVSVASPAGNAWAGGGALVADEGGITLRNTVVQGNTVRVNAHDAPGAQGGGIFDAPIDNGPPGGPLKLVGGSIIGNVLSGPAGASLQGGGVYLSDVPVSVAGTIIRHNVPDQCSGLTC